MKIMIERVGLLKVCSIYIVALLMITACVPQEGITPQAMISPKLTVQDQAFAVAADQYFTEAVQQIDAIPGIGVAVVRGGQIVYTKGFGVADVETGQKVNTNTLFYIASSTKSFTGLALNILHHRGVINLNETIGKAAPQINFSSELDAESVTLYELLTHTHGLSNDALVHRLAYSGEWTSDELWRLIGLSTLYEDAPRGVFEYDNTGYNIATAIIEKKIGKSWGEIVEDEILKPLGLKHTITNVSDGIGRDLDFARPHFGLGADGLQRLALEKTDVTMHSAGGMYASTDDMARWLQLYQDALRNRQDMPIPANIVAETFAPLVNLDASFNGFKRNHYGLGWYTGSYEDERFIHAFGDFVGFRSHVSFMPDRDLAVVVMINEQIIASRFADDAARFVYDWYKDEEGALEQARQGIAAFAAQIGQFKSRLAQGATQRAELSWHLSLPRTAYAGRYYNEAFGTIVISVNDNEIIAQNGSLRSVLEPSGEKDAARAEFLTLTGYAIKFRVENGSVMSLVTQQGVFGRMPT